MAKKKDQTSETDLGLAILQILASAPDGRATVGTVVKGIPSRVTLLPGDHLPSGTRPNEEIWEQRVRNSKSHDKSAGNIFGEGHVTIFKRGWWQITSAGRLHLKHKGA